MPENEKEKSWTFNDLNVSYRYEAFRHHFRIMEILESQGFRPNPEQKVFPNENLCGTKYAKMYS